MSTPRVRDELSRTLRSLRVAAGMTATQVAERTGFSQAKISRFETGKFVPSPEAAEAYARAVGASAADRRHVVALASDVRETAESRLVLLRAGSGGARRMQERILRIERQSAHIGTFSNTLIPGLLQTEEYARMVFASADISPQDVDGGVAGRTQRQIQAMRAGGRRYTQIVTHGALTWQAGSPALMARQCDHLADAAVVGDHFRVGVIPMSQPVAQFPLESFDTYDDRAVLMGTFTATAFMTKPSDVTAYLRLFSEMEGLAVFGGDAAAVFRGIAAQYREADA